MKKFNRRLAKYIEKDFLDKVVREISKPQSMRAAAKKLDISVYALKRLEDYYKLISTESFQRR